METDASKTVDDFISNLNDWRGETFANLRRIIREADPDVREEWKWMGSPVWSDNGMICVGITCKNKVKLTFYLGAHLPDPDKIFNNELGGKQW